MFMVTNPVTVVRSSGTIVSTAVSLGYDVPRQNIEALLLDAARSVDLKEPFVHIEDLGDFSVLFRVHGLLTEVKRLLSVRSQLRAAVLDHLHKGGIEIVSPNFMNQRVIPPGQTFIPRPTNLKVDSSQTSIAEEVIFDKADEAESLQELLTTRDKIKKELVILKEKIKEAATKEDGALEKKRLESESAILTLRMERFDKIIANQENRASEED